MVDMYSLFSAPPAAYRGKPFWSWNGELKRDELVRQAHVLGQMGFGGYFMHSRCGLITEYLGDEWFELTNAVADASQREGLEAWLYDEDRWPSGSAGGKVTEDVALRAKSLYLFECDPDSFTWEDDVIRAFAASVCSDGISLSGYCEIFADTLLQGEKSCDLWAELGDGAPKILVFKIIPDAPHSNYNGNTYIDTMNRAAVDRFIALTHEEYSKRCGARIGTSIKGIFTDEPIRGVAMGNLSEKDGVRSCSTFYTDDIFEEFRKHYGYDAEPMMPELFYYLHGEPVARVRIDYFDIGCNLFVERFAKPINDWCEAHNMVFTGHVLHEDDLTTQAVPMGSLMRFYEHMGTPGIDILGNSNYNYWAAKQCSSVCRQLEKKWMLSELYGCTGWEFNFRSHKRIGDWQALFGVNVRCPHLSWYTMEGQCKRDYPASISFQSPYWSEYDYIESYFARLGVALSAGKPVCDLLVLSPIESTWAISNLAWANWIFPAQDALKALQKTYAETLKKLCGAHVDFDYGEEQMMAQHCCIKDAMLYVGRAPYRMVLVSGALTLRQSTLTILQDFLEAGGRVVFTGELPAYVGGMASDACRNLLDNYENAVYVPFDELGAAMLALDTNPVHTDAPESVFNQVRRDGDDYVSVWLNTDGAQSANCFTVTFDCPDGCGADYRAEIWIPENGQRYVYPHSLQDDILSLTVSMDAAASMILVFTQNTDELELYNLAPVTKTGSLSDGEFAYTLEEPNVAVLDYARYRFEGDDIFSELGEVLKLDQQIRDRLGLERRGGEMLQPWFAKQMYTESYGKLSLEYPFEVQHIPAGKVYLAGERPELQQYYCNGVRLNYESLSEWWVDNAFVKMEIPAGTLKMGANVITVMTDFKQTTNTEAVYLVGDFGVQANPGGCVITTLPHTLPLGDAAQCKLPFYSGKCSIEIPPERYLPQVDENAEQIDIRIAAFTGSLVTVEYADIKQRIAWEPYTAQITEAVRKRLPLKITLVNSRRNSFGPLHISPVIQSSYGPDSFLTTGDAWTDEYGLIEAAIGEIEFLSRHS